MEPNPNPKDTEMSCTNDQIPEEVACRESLNKPAGTGVPVHAFHGAVPHVVALLICEHYPQRQRVDEARLDERNNMYVPIDAGATGKLSVDVWEEQRG